MVVALRAADRQTEPDRARRADAIDHAVDAELLDVDAAFLVEGRVAVEACGDALGFARVGQEVARELFQREAVEGQVGVERTDHPVAVFPDTARGVDRVAVAVGVAGLVEPPAAPALTIGGRGQEAIHLGGVGGLRVLSAGLQEGIEFGGSGRQAREVERETAQELLRRGFGGGGESGFLEALLDEHVDRSGTFLLQRRTNRGGESPVGFVGRAFFDPAAEGLPLLGRKLRLMGLRGRHHFFRILGEQTLPEFGLRRVARDDRADAVVVGQGALAGVEAEVGLAMLRVEAVAGEALLGKDRADLPVEGDLGVDQGGPDEREQ